VRAPRGALGARGEGYTRERMEGRGVGLRDGGGRRREVRPVGIQAVGALISRWGEAVACRPYLLATYKYTPYSNSLSNRHVLFRRPGGAEAGLGVLKRPQPAGTGARRIVSITALYFGTPTSPELAQPKVLSSSRTTSRHVHTLPKCELPGGYSSEAPVSPLGPLNSGGCPPLGIWRVMLLYG
jgi:hypothetical protein